MTICRTKTSVINTRKLTNLSVLQTTATKQTMSTEPLADGGYGIGKFLSRFEPSCTEYFIWLHQPVVESSWNVMAHGDAQEGKRRGNWRLEWVGSTLHTASGHGVSSITTADARTSAASSRLNWRPRWFKWTRLSRRNMKSGFCTCAITFQMQSSNTDCQEYTTTFLNVRKHTV